MNLKSFLILFSILVIAVFEREHYVFAGENRWTVLKKRVFKSPLDVLVVDPSNPNVLYASVLDTGILKSVDGGKHWEPKNYGLLNRAIQKIVIDPYRPNMVYACTKGGLYRSNNGGEQWEPIGFTYDTAVNAVAVAPHTMDTLYAAIDSDIYRSLNGGKSWYLIPDTIQATIRAIVVSPWNPIQLYIGTDVGIYMVQDFQDTVEVLHGFDEWEQRTENHLPPLFKRLNADKKLREYIKRIQAGERIKFYPRENRRQAQLELLGILKADDSGYCIIRNRIYELTLKDAASDQRKLPTFQLLKKSKINKPKLYTDLKLNIQNKSEVVFVGAGLSVGAGLPNWYALISELGQQINLKLPPARLTNSDTLIDAAQTYVNSKEEHSLLKFLKERLDTTGKSFTVAHKALAQLPISLVLTANYDDFLERAYRDAGKRVQVIVQDSDIAYWLTEPDAVNIIKLYGDLNQPGTIVLARQQYEKFFMQRRQIIKLLETELVKSYVLYLGWSHGDPYFNIVFGELLHRFGQHMRPAYAVMYDVPKDRRKELERKKINLVELGDGNRTEQIANWLSSLV